MGMCILYSSLPSWPEIMGKNDGREWHDDGSNFGCVVDLALGLSSTNSSTSWESASLYTPLPISMIGCRTIQSSSILLNVPTAGRESVRR